MASLAEQAQKQIFQELKKLVDGTSKQSMFAVGGTIPITNLNSHLICESDETASDDEKQRTNRTKGSGDRGDPMLIESPIPTNKTQIQINDSTVHRMRCDPVTIRWDSLTEDGVSRKVTLPCSDAERPSFEQLLKDCQPATFGLGGKDVLDETYRKAGKIDETAFSTNFSPYALGIVDTAAQALAPNTCRQTNETHGIRAELYKLNVYGAPSGKFKAHVDTPRSKHQISSLVVCLPSEHTGGQLVLRHQGREIVFDWSGEKGKSSIQWAAFYSDCEHEVLEVTSGQRVTLTYNLFATCRANTAWIDKERVELYQTLKTVLAQPAFCKNGARIGYYCVHAYPHTRRETIEALPATLKGADKVVYECFFGTGASVSVRHVLDMEIGELEEYVHEGNDVFKQILDNADTQDIPRFKDLLEDYRRVEVTGWNNWKALAWMRKDNYEDAEHPWHEEVAITAGLTPFKYTNVGMSEEDSIDIVNEWNSNFTVEKIKWLNQPSTTEMAMVHGAYGNQADMDTKYVSMAIVLDVPPYDQR